jgi:hypothetical protein
MNAHFQFLSRTEAGPAVIFIEDIKRGRQLSTLHATLYQGGLLDKAPWFTPGSTRKPISAYLTMTDLSKEQGVSLPVPFNLDHPLPPPPKPNFTALKENLDRNWERFTVPRASPLGSMRCLQNCIYYAPRGGQAIKHKHVIDKWVRLASGEKFTASSLGYVADCWPYVVEAYRPPPPSNNQESVSEQSRHEHDPFPHDAKFWYPTVVLNLEVKKALPEEGVEWLQLRIQSKQVKRGRLDLEVIVLDEDGELVALSNHVNLIVGSERNTAGRSSHSHAAAKEWSRI